MGPRRELTCWDLRLPCCDDGLELAGLAEARGKVGKGSIRTKADRDDHAS